MLVLLFLPFSALDKVLNFKAAVAQARHAVRSTGLATGLIVTGLCTEIVMSAGVLTGVGDRLAAFILAGYCILTALLWKQFWKAADFKLKGPSQGREIFWDFLKNVAVAGGFCVLTFGTSARSAAVFLHHPLSSTHPYTGAGE
jgi:putative oxidoreductase